MKKLIIFILIVFNIYTYSTELKSQVFISKDSSNNYILSDTIKKQFKDILNKKNSFYITYIEQKNNEINAHNVLKHTNYKLIENMDTNRIDPDIRDHLTKMQNILNTFIIKDSIKVYCKIKLMNDKLTHLRCSFEYCCSNNKIFLMCYIIKKKLFIFSYSDDDPELRQPYHYNLKY